MEEKISCMAIVVAGKNKKKALLLNSEGEWVFPKGHVENGETFIQTALRELYEEAKISITEKDCIGQVDEFSFFFDGENATKIIKVFGFKIEKPQKIMYNKDECFIDGKWVDIEKVSSLLKHDDAKAAFEKFLKLI